MWTAVCCHGYSFDKDGSSALDQCWPWWEVQVPMKLPFAGIALEHTRMDFLPCTWGPPSRPSRVRNVTLESPDFAEVSESNWTLLSSSGLMGLLLWFIQALGIQWWWTRCELCLNQAGYRTDAKTNCNTGEMFAKSCTKGVVRNTEEMHITQTSWSICTPNFRASWWTTAWGYLDFWLLFQENALVSYFINYVGHQWCNIFNWK